MKKTRYLIIALALSFMGHSALAEEAGALVHRSETLRDRLNSLLFPELKQPSLKWYGISFALRPTRNGTHQADHAARKKRHLQEQVEPFPAQQPANNLLHVRY